MEDLSAGRDLAITERLERLETTVGEIQAHLRRLGAAGTGGVPLEATVAPPAPLPMSAPVARAAPIMLPKTAGPERAIVPPAEGAPRARPARPPLAASAAVPLVCSTCGWNNWNTAAACGGCGRPVAAQLAPPAEGATPSDAAPPAEEAAPQTIDPATTLPPRRPPPAPAPAPAMPRPAWLGVSGFDVVRSSEFWLNKIGIGLLLLGVAFLFMYAVDQGWLTPQVRLGIGLAIGTVLAGFGFRFQPDRPHFSQVLLGGAIATYYITGFAAFQLFNRLVPFAVVFPYMGLVTFLAFVLAVRQDAVMLALIGTVGGLATPFLLHTDQGSVAGLVGYTCLVLLGTSAIYLYRSWRLLLWTAFLGGWAVFLIAYLGRLPDQLWAVQGGFAFGWLAFWAVPVGRDVLARRAPARWPQPPLEALAQTLSVDARVLAAAQLHLLTVLTPLLALGLSMALWPWQKPVWGWVALGGAGIYGLVAWGLRPIHERLAYTHGMLGLLFFTLGCSLLLPADLLFLTLAAEGLALHLTARRFADAGTGLAANLLFLWVETWFFGERLLTQMAGQTAIFNPRALADLAVIGLLLAASTVIRPRLLVPFYRLVLHGMVLGWLARELLPLPDGVYYLSLAVVAYATLLHLLTRQQPDLASQLTAHAIFLAAGAGLIISLLLFPLGWALLRGRAGLYSIPLLDIGTLTHLALIALLVIASLLVQPRPVAWLYRATGYSAVLGWLALVLVQPGAADPWLGVMLAWAGYALGLQAVARRWTDPPSAAVGHDAFMVIGLWLFTAATRILSIGHWLGDPGSLPFLNLPALVSLAITGGALAASLLVQPRELAWTYRVGVHLAALSLLARELSMLLYDGIAWAMLAWAVYAGGLLLLARRRLPFGAEPSATALAHLTFAAAGLWVVMLSWLAAFAMPRALGPAFAPSLPATLIGLAIIGLALAASRIVATQELRGSYRLASCLILLSWLAGVLAPLPDGWSWVMLAWAALVLGLHATARRGAEPPASLLAHSVFAVTGGWFFWELWQGTPGLARLNVPTYADLALLLLAFAASFLVAGHAERLAYRFAVHGAILIWLGRELLPLPHGSAFVTVAWGLYGLALLLVGLRRNFERLLIYTAMSTLLLVVGKLLLLDLAALEQIWRILLFLGFGGVFLVLSYYFQNLIRRGPTHGGKPA